METEKRGKRDFRTHPPGSVEEAKNHIELLRESEEHINTQIDTTIADDFEDDDSFDDWLGRAQRALAMTRTQRKFLERWVGQRDPEFKVPVEAEEKRVRYSHANPPGSVEEAKTRTKALSNWEGEIQAQLDVKNPQDFADELAFKDWKRRAKYALTKKQVERNFLEGWIREREPGFLSAADQIVENFRQKAETIAGEVSDMFRQQYSNQYLPSDLLTARARTEALKEVETRLNASIADLRTECERHVRITERQFISIRSPLNYLLGMVRAELKVLKEFIRTYKENPCPPPPVAKKVKAPQKNLRAPKGVKPPANIKDAEARINAIDEAREDLCRAIAVTTAENFEGEGTFHEWHQKTHRLFLKTTIERGYLLRWIREWIPSFVPEKNDELQKIADAILLRARVVIREMSDLCTPEYSAEQPPSNPHAAKERWEKLDALQKRISECIVELRTEWYSHPLSREQFNKEVRAPLVRMLESMKTEFAVIKPYLGKDTTQPSMEKSFLTELVARAIASGVELTPDEKMKFDSIARQVQGQ